MSHNNIRNGGISREKIPSSTAKVSRNIGRGGKREWVVRHKPTASSFTGGSRSADRKWNKTGHNRGSKDLISNLVDEIEKFEGYNDAKREVDDELEVVPIHVQDTVLTDSWTDVRLKRLGCFLKGLDLNNNPIRKLLVLDSSSPLHVFVDRHVSRVYLAELEFLNWPIPTAPLLALSSHFCSDRACIKHGTADCVVAVHYKYMVHVINGCCQSNNSFGPMCQRCHEAYYGDVVTTFDLLSKEHVLVDVPDDEKARRVSMVIKMDFSYRDSSRTRFIRSFLFSLFLSLFLTLMVSGPFIVRSVNRSGFLKHLRSPLSIPTYEEDLIYHSILVLIIVSFVCITLWMQNLFGRVLIWLFILSSLYMVTYDTPVWRRKLLDNNSPPDWRVFVIIWFFMFLMSTFLALFFFGSRRRHRYRFIKFTAFKGSVFVDLRCDVMALVKLLHTDAVYAVVRYSCEEGVIFDLFSRILRFLGFVSWREDMNVSLELFVQLASPSNLAIDSDEVTSWNRINHSSRTLQTVNINRYLVTLSEYVAQDTVLLTYGLYMSMKEDIFHFPQCRAPQSVK